VVLIAGGTSGEEASSDVYSFDTHTGAVRTIAHLPHPVTHAAGAALGGALLVIGGRGAQTGTQHSTILAVTPAGAITQAGLLPAPLSDAAAAASGGGVLLAGGTDRSGNTQAGVLKVSLGG
jgi:N-acetylneuraminic acid mutarotase